MILSISKFLVFISLLFPVLVKVKENYLPRHYIFEPARLQELSQQALSQTKRSKNSTEVLLAVHANLKKEYGDYINDFDVSEWVFNNAGNAMGTMLVLHASISEYLIFFGTAVGTEGHTGTHFADDYFTILYGEQLAALASRQQPERYLPGEMHHLPWGYNKQYRMPEDSWALELAQGYIPSMLPFGFVEALTSTLDFWSLGKTVRISAVNIVKNLLRGKV